MNLRTETGGHPPIPHPVNRLLGSKTGIVKTLLHYLPDRSDPAVFYSTAVEADLTEVAGIQEAGSLDAGGTALTLRDSRLRTLGEAAERYCLHFPDPDGLVMARHRDLARSSRSVVGFEYLDVFDHEELTTVGLDPVTPDSNVEWQVGVDLLTGKEVLLPAQQVWLTTPDHGTRWYPTTSNGTACAPSLEEALIGAITERIERDAVMRTWYRQLTPGGIRVGADDPLAKLVSSRFETAHRRIHFIEFETPVDLPVIGCVAVDRRDRPPRFTIAGDADLVADRAMQGALVESAQSWAYLKDLVANHRDRSIDPDRIYSLEDNLLYYALPEQAEDVAFLLDGNETDRPTQENPTESPAETLAQLVEAVDQAGLTPIAVDVTTRDIKEVGLFVVRVVIPELLDLALPSLPPVAHPALAGHRLTTKPHPYP